MTITSQVEIIQNLRAQTDKINMKMLGITEIASYIPTGRVSNYDRRTEFGVTAAFLENRIGVRRVAVKAVSEETSDLCVAAYRNLLSKVDLDPAEVDSVIVVTQNPDRNIPHTSAIVHGKLGLSESCACFDVSLGCSGYVYGLSIILGFMERAGLGMGLLFTADPYSKVVDSADKNTALLFGDAATVTLVSGRCLYRPTHFTFGTLGSQHGDLMCQDGKLFMNGHSIYNFVIEHVPKDVEELLRRSGLAPSEVDRFLFHQGSRHMVDTLVKRMRLDPTRVPYSIEDYGNTVSSSIPLMLEWELVGQEARHIVLSGFGVGLSWASALLLREGAVRGCESQLRT